ncbi:MAG TPA: N-acetylglucosamine-6-phosphate deacetylase [Planctomycetota bacterium]|nr:N-acetylglucosamine-6-phosphate deacetylase [Planctomycetota bacterium]
MSKAGGQQGGARVFRGVDVLTRGRRLRGCALLVARGKVRAVGKAAERLGRKLGARRVDLGSSGGAYLAPGYLDLHTHGAVGVNFMETDTAGLERAALHYLSCGVTGLLLSLYPSTFKESIRVLESLSRSLDAGAGGGVFLGIHLEGPYLNPKRPGALPASYFLTYRSSEVDGLLRAGGGWVRTMTIAPEMPGGMALVRHLLRRAVVPAFGHSDAAYDATRRSIDGGVRYATHLFNAMRGIHHRDPGAVTALLEDPRVAVELIADGYHVDVAVLRLVHAVKHQNRVVVVSDSIHPCGLKPGSYRFAGGTVIARGGRVTLEDGTLAGSLLSLDRAVALHVHKVGLSPEDSVLLASGNPARVLGIERSRGDIAPGRRADMVLLDENMKVQGTWLAGERVFG